MTATDELRRLLDERGVDYVGTHQAFTAWWGDHDIYWSAMEVYDGELELGTNMSNVSPEQAIAATLGTGTCHITPQFTCSECGHQYPTRNYECYETCDGRTAYASLGYDVLDCKKPNYCPNCGRKVVDA